MNIRGDSKASAWVYLLGRSIALILFSKPDLPLPSNEVPDLVDSLISGSSRSTLWRQGAVDRACFLRCQKLANLGTVLREIIVVLRQLLYPPAVTHLANLLAPLILLYSLSLASLLGSMNLRRRTAVRLVHRSA